jgi:hypothetical protein
MRRLLAPTLAVVTALLLAGVAHGAAGRPATTAESKSIFAAEPFLGLAQKCVPLHIAIESAFAGVWVTDITGLALEATGKGVVNCASDSVSLPGSSAALLPLARPLSVGPFTCTAAAASFTCTTAADHAIWFGRNRSWRVS